MSETENQQELIDQEEVLTPEQIAAYRKNMLNYYKEQMPLLKAQLEYERTVADIEEARVKALTMVIRQAQIKAGPPREPEPSPNGEPSDLQEQSEKGVQIPKGQRKLKTQ